MGREQAWPLSTSILIAPPLLSPGAPRPQAALESVVGLDWGEGGWVNIFKCLRYVLDIFSFKLER